MSVYKTIYKDKEGRKRRAVKWYIDIFYHNQLRDRIQAFADKRLSEALLRNIDTLVNCQIARIPLTGNGMLLHSIKSSRRLFNTRSHLYATFLMIPAKWSCGS